MIPTPRPPSVILVVDSNIVLAAVIGRSRPLLDRLASSRLLAITERTQAEIIRVVGNRPGTTDRMLGVARDILFGLQVAYEASYVHHMEAAARVLGAPGHPDAHLLAFAWAADADLWTHDRDFFGTGWPAWTSANLRLALGV